MARMRCCCAGPACAALWPRPCPHAACCSRTLHFALHLAPCLAPPLSQPAFEVLAVAVSSGLVAFPTAYTRVWSGAGGTIWRPVPPPGYVAAGDVVTLDGQEPELSAVACLHGGHLQRCSLLLLRLLVWCSVATGMHRLDVPTPAAHSPPPTLPCRGHRGRVLPRRAPLPASAAASGEHAGGGIAASRRPLVQRQQPGHVLGIYGTAPGARAQRGPAQPAGHHARSTADAGRCRGGGLGGAGQPPSGRGAAGGGRAGGGQPAQAAGRRRNVPAVPVHAAGAAH